ncbi:MAG: hypothetical protein UW25_C0004G0109 [Candidatus Nomurabacteria bacterium GW2011_GWB1_44_12]|uniref:DUF302 domain-containing protein n=1 Tax=Candidatus Nomurabacteria bacterium GW2011_GWB1_44_12 TaxID=1618748 RepID=A0A837ID24_9BACT|nr:MAG: hypothetical protein UW25_C0004G0109 [Candidatus Nomurabacteria bacterium GW2011_GWB1_44_12]
MEFDYTTTTTKSFDEAVDSVQEEIAKAGMRVLYVHDVQKSLVEKGFARDSFKIIEFCNAKYANEFLNADIKIGLCMPCKINVYIKQFFPNANLGVMPEEIDKAIKNIIDSAK